MRVAQGQRRGRQKRGHEQGRLGRFAVAVLAVALIALAVLIAGCGSSASTGSSADPAGVAPAYAPVYVGAVVRPSGSLKSEALAAGQALTHQHNPMGAC